MNLELREADILCSVFAARPPEYCYASAGHRALVSVSPVLCLTRLSYSVPVSRCLIHPQWPATRTSHHQARHQGTEYYGICGDHQFSIQQRPRAGAGWWRAGARTGEDTANITQHYTTLHSKHYTIQFNHRAQTLTH